MFLKIIGISSLKSTTSMTIFLFQISGLSLSSDEEDLATKYLATIQALAVSFLYTDTSESIVISYNLFR